MKHNGNQISFAVRPDAKLGKKTVSTIGKYFASEDGLDGYNVLEVLPQQLTATERDFLCGNSAKRTQVLDETVTDLKAIIAPVFPNLSTLVIGNTEQVVTGLATALAGLTVTVVVPNSLLSAYQTAYASATNLTFTSWQFQQVFTIPYIGENMLTAEYVRFVANNASGDIETVDKVIVPSDFTDYEPEAYLQIVESFPNAETVTTQWGIDFTPEEIEELDGKIAEEYGVSGEAQADSLLTRIASSIGKTFSINSSAGTISSDFDSCYPWSDITEVTDANGNVFVRIPKFYISRVYDSASQTFTTKVCRVPRDSSYVLSPAFKTYDGTAEKDYCYIGKYTTSGNSEHLYSKSGTGSSRLGQPDTRTACAANGYGYGMMDYWQLELLQVLFTIEFATTDCQSVMRGRVDGGGPTNTGKCDFLGANKSGWDPTTMCMSYRGVENLWGNSWQWLDGCTRANGTVYICETPSEYESGKTASPYVGMSYGIIGSIQIAKRLGYDPSYPLVSFPTEGLPYNTQNPGYYRDTSYMDGACFRFGAEHNYENNAGLWSFAPIQPSYSSYGRLAFFDATLPQ